MLPKIKKLSKNVSLLISAGEVIDNPVSIIKELVENSIDAKAKKIIIEIKNGGKEYISITDDGYGINPNEIELAFETHSTSKLSTKDDIYNVSSLGFRGEALSSISSISKIKCISRIKENNFATSLEIKFGEKLNKTNVGANYGTKIIINEIFHNIPARLKFLQKGKSESGKITNFIKSIALGHPEISFRLIIDDFTKFTTDGDNNQITNLIKFYKLKNLDFIDINIKENNYELSGYISKPDNNFGNRSRMHISVNNRLIKNNNFFYTIENAYKNFISKRFPIICLNIKIPFNEVDVNVHPQKHEIKLEKENEILSFIYNNLTKILNSEIPSNSITFELNQNRVIGNYENRSYEQDSLFVSNEPISLKNAIPLLRYIGQIKNSFILCEGPDGLYIIDQHAAHERILFEKYSNQNQYHEFQVLNINRYIDLGSVQNNKIINELEKFRELGWDIDESATGEIIVRNVPHVGLYKTKDTDLEKILSIISNDLNNDTDTPKNIISKRLACHSAVRAGDKLNDSESINLINDLEKTEIPWDPHGRPAVIKLDYSNIASQFGR
jgi:DNA mismatch repair protein MutL|tara:strand:- start:9257 stop:10927 length:1671 start_codon:yes stop_codon:yes gene_type:complete